MDVKIGDTVRVWKFVYDREYEGQGRVEMITDDGHIFVDGDYYRPINDLMNKCEIISVVDPATQKQIDYLRALGWNGDEQTLRKSIASAEIDQRKLYKNAIGSCYYCGGPANGFDFFGELACAECGGK